jgi:ketosteroid isomerase-like protein
VTRDAEGRIRKRRMEADDYIAIMNLASQYAHTLDDCDWDGLGACFTPDAVVEFTAQPEPLRGRQAIVDFIRTGRRRFDVTQHVIGTPSVEVVGDTAQASFYVVAQHVVGRDGPTRRCVVGVRYDDALRRTSEGWRLAHRKTRRLWTEGDATLVESPDPSEG